MSIKLNIYLLYWYFQQHRVLILKIYEHLPFIYRLKSYVLFINGKMRLPFIVICYTDVSFKADLTLCTYYIIFVHNCLFIQHIANSSWH